MMTTPHILVTSTINGIKLWGLKVVPGLFIAFIIVGCLNYYIPENTDKGIWLCLITGIFSGFPAGAFNCAKYYQLHKDTTSIDIMAYCNISSSGFVINYIYYEILSCNMPFVVFIACVYIPVIILSVITIVKSKSKNKHKKNQDKTKFSHCKADNYNFITMLNQTLNETINSILKLGGYIVLFSCICAYIDLLFKNMPFINIFLCSISEITNGMYLAAACDIPLKTPVILMINAFGGISTLMQTAGITKSMNVDMNLRKYVINKIKLALLTGLTSFILLWMF